MLKKKKTFYLINLGFLYNFFFCKILHNIQFSYKIINGFIFLEEINVGNASRFSRLGSRLCSRLCSLVYIVPKHLVLPFSPYI